MIAPEVAALPERLKSDEFAQITQLEDVMILANCLGDERLAAELVRRYNDAPSMASALLRLQVQNAVLVEACKDLLGGWRYIRQTHGDLYGVGWDRAQSKGESALAAAEGGAR